MKKLYRYMSGAALLMLATGCSHELLVDMNGEGNLLLNTSVNSDMKVVSRAVEDSLRENCMIWISNEKGLIRRYNSYSELPEGPIALNVGSYVAEAWTGDSIPASWDKRWFKGVEQFTIAKGETTNVELVCKIANVAASVSYAEGIENVLSDFTMTIGHQIDTLVFVGREERRGYFMMPSIDKNLTFELKGIQIDGSEFSYKGVIEDAQPATEYAIKVGYTQESTEVGGVIFTIEIDEQEIEMSSNVELVPAPKFTGYGFDIAQPLMGEMGTFHRTTVYVSSATKINRVELQSELFKRIAELGGYTDFEILSMNEGNQAVINNFGIDWKYSYDEDLDQTLVQINFAEALLNSLENGEYTVDFTAFDSKYKSTKATLTILVSDAPVVTKPATEISYFSATLNGSTSKDNIEGLGFKYRKVGDADWSNVDAVLGSDGRFTAKVEGLYDRSTYEYFAVTPDFESQAIETFTTLSAQLPNSGFEEWYLYNSKIWIPGSNYTSNFWDSGNHGGSLVSKNFTTQNSQFKHSGSYSACLKSEKVLIQFAAGNIFAGKYLDTDGTNGILGWGRPFTHTPKSVNIWVKYSPVSVTGNAGDHIKRGDLDQGIIYIALVDDSKLTYKNEEWPCVIKTKASERNLFDKNGANVIAYGEHVFTEATEGNDLILVNIPIEYFKPGVTPSNIIFVASASRYGDYFEGGDGSTMYIDDIELIYY